MNRHIRYIIGASAALLVAATQAFCADLLVDDFTDEGASHPKWMISNSDILSATIGGGSCTLVNSSNQSIAEYLHTFSPKPSTFTASYLIKSLSSGGDAGLFFCRASALNGYYLTVYHGSVAVFKYVNGNGTSVFFGNDYDLKPSDNKFTVSKNDSKFNIFVNDVFQGSFTDDLYPSGDISLFVGNGTSAVFGDFRMTDVFTEGSPRTSFSDNFEGNNLKYWNTAKIGSPSATEGGGVLTVNTKSSENSVLWMYVDFEHANFTAKVEARYSSGSKSSEYGLVLIGEPPAGQTNIPMAHFAINGDREYAVWGPNDNTYTPEKKQDILGAGYVDHIEIRKSTDSQYYEFFANNTPIATYPAASVTFKVVGVGIFCSGDLEVTFDNFSLQKEGTPTSVNWNQKQISRAPSSLTPRSHAFYDLRGRKRYTAATSNLGRAQVRAAGIYVNKTGRDVAVRKGKVLSD